MKKLLLPLAILAASPVQAQSSLAIFGVADVNLQHTKGTASVTALGRGGINGSRIGFRGVEDLGGGLAATFHLEAGFDPDTGAGRPTSADNVTSGASGGGLTFNRRSTVSLRGGWGEVRLGRDYTPVADNHTDFDTFGNSGVPDASILTQALAIGLVAGSGVKTDIRASNSIGYHLPSDLGGFYGNAMYAMGENLTAGTVTKGDGDHRGARVGWADKTVNVALAYGKTTMASQDDLDNVHLGASWKVGGFELFGQLSRERTRVASVRYTNDALHLGGIYAVGAGLVKVSYTRADLKPASGAAQKANMLAVGYQHNFSRRTALYAQYARIDNNSAGIFDLGRPVNPGGTSSGAQIGVRHRF